MQHDKPLLLAPADKAAWRARWQAKEAKAVRRFERNLRLFPARITSQQIAGVEHLLVTPANLNAATGKRLLLYFHGGAFTMGNPERNTTAALAAAHYSQSRVLSVRYPMAWQAPHPAIDYELNLVASARIFAGTLDLTDPSVSPLYADFAKGFPPAYISTGTRDLLLSTAARLQRKLTDAGVANRLYVHEGMWHSFQIGPKPTMPEARAAWIDMTGFFDRHLGR